MRGRVRVLAVLLGCSLALPAFTQSSDGFSDEPLLGGSSSDPTETNVAVAQPPSTQPPANKKRVVRKRPGAKKKRSTPSEEPPGEAATGAQSVDGGAPRLFDESHF